MKACQPWELIGSGLKSLGLNVSFKDDFYQVWQAAASTGCFSSHYHSYHPLCDGQEEPHPAASPISCGCS